MDRFHPPVHDTVSDPRWGWFGFWAETISSKEGDHEHKDYYSLGGGGGFHTVEIYDATYLVTGSCIPMEFILVSVLS